MPNLRTQTQMKEDLEKFRQREARKQQLKDAWELATRGADLALLEGNITNYFKAENLVREIEDDMRKEGFTYDN